MQWSVNIYEHMWCWTNACMCPLLFVGCGRCGLDSVYYSSQSGLHLNIGGKRGKDTLTLVEYEGKFVYTDWCTHAVLQTRKVDVHSPDY